MQHEAHSTHKLGQATCFHMMHPSMHVHTHIHACVRTHFSDFFSINNEGNQFHFPSCETIVKEAAAQDLILHSLMG
jgi:hypothetical protein